ncbi:hypothetical protein DM02DRAFT_625343 [Periconia macrospinosa]|uniref:CCHC-type domain-containing protein n=1 Tax=Periconia macrospinosa TaxID=97972 RepID=A0A2V1E499_9PLEO|nr:hypothetical protein DM02DRAFT_625343 [Periconia macrospinosa]
MRIVRLMLEPKVMDYQPYMNMASVNQAFKHDLDAAIQQNLKYRIKRGQDYYNAKAASKVCYRCHVAGHVVRDCPNVQKKTHGYEQYRQPKIVQVSSNGEGLRTCDRVTVSEYFLTRTLKTPSTCSINTINDKKQLKFNKISKNNMPSLANLKTGKTVTVLARTAPEM